MSQRARTATIFAITMLLGVYGGKYTFFILFALILAGCHWELAGMLFARSNYPKVRQYISTAVGLFPFLIAGWETIIIGDLDEDVQLYALASVFFSLLGLFIAELFLHDEKPFNNLGHYILGQAYLSIPYTVLTALAMWTGEYSPNRVFGLMWLVWTNDTMAYLVGSRIGRRKLFERISPGKTWEGMLGGLASTLIMSWTLSLILTDYTQIQWVILAVIISVMGTLGDLIESMLKRSTGVKDSGDFFPGHGGFLDRFDAFQFSLPFAWAALYILK